MKKLVLVLSIITLVALAGIFLSSPKAQTHSLDSWVGSLVTVSTEPFRSNEARPMLYQDVRLLAVNFSEGALSEIIIEQGSSRIILPRHIIFSITKKA